MYVHDLYNLSQDKKIRGVIYFAIRNLSFLNKLTKLFGPKSQIVIELLSLNERNSRNNHCNSSYRKNY